MIAPKNIVCIVYILLLFGACKKESIQKYKQVQYQVVVYPGNEVGIIYQSDYYTHSGKQTEIIINDANNNYSGNTWFANHIQEKEEPYYIKVTYKNYNNPNNLNYGVFVFVNDTLIDQFVTNTYQPEIVLTGKVR